MPGYHPSNLMFGTPEQVYDRIKAAQEACSFSEITILSNFGTMPYEIAVESTRLFAQEVSPDLHKLSTPVYTRGDCRNHRLISSRGRPVQDIES